MATVATVAPIGFSQVAKWSAGPWTALASVSSEATRERMRTNYYHLQIEALRPTMATYNLPEPELSQVLIKLVDLFVEAMSASPAPDNEEPYDHQFWDGLHMELTGFATPEVIAHIERCIARIERDECAIYQLGALRRMLDSVGR